MPAKLITQKGCIFVIPTNNMLQPFCVDFAQPKTLYRLDKGGKHQQPLAKAIGTNNKQQLSIIDATAGFGSDSLILASLNCKVTLIEKSPIVAKLLQDGLKRASNNSKLTTIIANMTQLTGDAVDIIPTLPPHDVIYLDPMFPTKHKTAAVNKAMQILQEISAPPNELLLDISLQHATKKVVVKRAKASPYLSNIKPTFSKLGKANRFDIYMI